MDSASDNEYVPLSPMNSTKPIQEQTFENNMVDD